MSRLVIYGAGGFGKGLASMARRAGRHFVFVDDRPSDPLLGVQVLPGELGPMRRMRAA